ncbi:hypothetical protein M9H77_14034 [Catharanthus roseus]|uniref:Uncharacterized protein n=1 Tax=Catharanthus roseus TaxID=4058 RepID=A0ACC0BLW0_CATRO|nr:hypothetical protein M9H77_14034 [Catharanthus roseus]
MMTCLTSSDYVRYGRSAFFVFDIRFPLFGEDILALKYSRAAASSSIAPGGNSLLVNQYGCLCGCVRYTGSGSIYAMGERSSVTGDLVLVGLPVSLSVALTSIIYILMFFINLFLTFALTELYKVWSSTMAYHYLNRAVPWIRTAVEKVLG